MQYMLGQRNLTGAFGLATIAIYTGSSQETKQDKCYA